MQGRFGAQAVQGDEYLLRLTRYVHLNPVFVGSLRGESLEVRREVLRRYRWSSYRGYARLAPPYGFVQEGPLLALVEGAEVQKREAYRQYGCVARAVCALLLVRCSGMTQRDVAAFLGMGTGAAVCQQLQGLRIRLGTETALAERIEHVRHRLESAAFPAKSPNS